MFNTFQNFVEKEKLFTVKTKLLLAFSGGADSVCLFHLLLKGGYNFSIAHCNFNLRGAESKADEAFAIELAHQYSIQCFVNNFNTKKYMKEQKLNVQEAARNLRYEWFESLIKEHHFKKLITAHHQTDNAETMLINMLRGTGIKGLHGILFNKDNMARPLMYATKEHISSFLKTNKIEYREDSSNDSDKYIRNQIRHHVLKNLANINPAFESNFFNTSQQVWQFEKLSTELITKQWQKLCTIHPDNIIIDVKKLNKIENKHSFLFYNLQPYGFNIEQINSMLDIKSDKVGRTFFSNQYQLTQDKNTWHLTPIETAPKLEALLIEKPIHNLKIGAQILSIQKLKNTKTLNFSEKNKLYLNADLITFPLVLRVWQAGDKIIPLGMKGSKKISDILTNKKIQKTERQHILVLENLAKEIIALVPLVIHNHYQITPNSKNILAITLKKA